MVCAEQLLFFVKDLSICRLLAALLPQSGTTFPTGPVQENLLLHVKKLSSQTCAPQVHMNCERAAAKHIFYPFNCRSLDALNPCAHISIFKPIFFLTQKNLNSVIPVPTSVLISDALEFCLAA